MSRTTYERLKAFCEANNISMSQLVETRVNDFLGEGGSAPISAPAPRPASTSFAPARTTEPPRPVSPLRPESRPVEVPRAAPQPVPMTSAAARFAVEPPPPIIKPRQQESAPKPAEKRPEQIFTF